MFTIKACVLNPSGDETFQLYAAHEVHVRHAEWQEPQSLKTLKVIEVEMFADNRHVTSVLVGPSYFHHYQCVYVMNEFGKTVQRIQPPEWLAPQ